MVSAFILKAFRVFMQVCGNQAPQEVMGCCFFLTGHDVDAWFFECFT